MDRRDFIKAGIFVTVAAITGVGVASPNEQVPVSGEASVYPDIAEVMQKHTNTLIDNLSFNDKVTRNEWSKLVTDDIERLGYDRHKFIVICDETNNTPNKINANEFHAMVDIAHPYTKEFHRLTIGAHAHRGKHART